MTEVPIAPEVRILLDKQEIQDALMRYCRGVDRCDVELMRSIFHEDGRAFKGPAWEFVEHFIPANREATTFTVHFMGNLLIDVVGDDAFSEAYFMTYAGRDEGGQELIDVFAGRYVDHWVRRNGRWGVLLRETVHEWSRADVVGRIPFPVPPSEQGTFVQPIRGRGDISFAR
ncbi:MAG: nuclear transport factor 2 family protein [Chloroflexota bacterium]|nr:nuclear transport factor 2 family protein [Chloroflexota bacterium]